MISYENLNIELYKKLLKNSLKDNYNELLYFFEYILMSDYTIKIIMSRKCYCLFRVFEPILRQRLYNSEGEASANRFKNIFSDRSIYFNANFIDDSINNNNTVLIADDIMRFGRTVAGFAEDITKVFKINRENIAVCIFAALDTYLERDSKENFAYFTNDCMLKYKKLGSEMERDFSDDDPNIKVVGGWCFYNESSINKMNGMFIEAINAVGEPYSGYTPYFYLHFNDLKDFCKDFTEKTSALSFLQEQFKDYNITDSTVPQHNKYGVYAFLASKKSNNNNESVYVSLRIIVHPKLERIVISPMAFIPDLILNDEAFKTFKEIVGLSFSFEDRLREHTEKLTVARYNTILYTYSYLEAQDFIRTLFSKAETDTNKLNSFTNNHYKNADRQYVIQSELSKLTLNKKYNFFQVFDKKASADDYYNAHDKHLNTKKSKSSVDTEKCFQEVVGQLEGIKMDNTCEDKVYEFLSLLFLKLVKNDKPIYLKKGRYLTAKFKNYIKNAFVCESKNQRLWSQDFIDNNFKNHTFYCSFVKTFELGVSGTRINCVNDKAYMVVQEGESAENVLSMPTSELYDSLRWLNNGLGKEFNYHKKNIYPCFEEYFKQRCSHYTNGSVSLSRLKMLFDEDINLYDSSKDTYNESDRAFYSTFTVYYLNNKPKDLIKFREILEAALTKMEREDYNISEIKNIKIVLQYVNSVLNNLVVLK